MVQKKKKKKKKSKVNCNVKCFSQLKWFIQCLSLAGSGGLVLQFLINPLRNATYKYDQLKLNALLKIKLSHIIQSR